MTLKTILDPLDRLSLAEWRDEIASWLKTTYAAMSTADQTQLNRIIAETQEFLLKRAAGRPWGEREDSASTVTAGTDTTYAFRADMREVIWIREESSSTVLLAHLTTKREYGAAGESYGTNEHPWQASVRPYWFYDGANSSSPSAQQWRRIGASNSGATIRVYYIPLLSLSDPELPASEVAAAREHARYKWSLYARDYEAAAMYRQAREDDIAANDTLGRTTVDAGIMQGLDSDFTRQMGG